MLKSLSSTLNIIILQLYIYCCVASNYCVVFYKMGFHGGSLSKESCNAIDVSLIPGSGRFPGKGHDKPLQYSCLENPMD